MEKGISSNELLSMIKFGADEIFSTDEINISEADIDLILREGEAKAEEIQEKLKKNATNLLNFSLKDNNEASKNIYQFMGVDYKSERKIENSASSFER